MIREHLKHWKLIPAFIGVMYLLALASFGVEKAIEALDRYINRRWPPHNWPQSLRTETGHQP